MEMQAEKRFREAQMFNFQQRMESRHHATQTAPTTSFAATTRASSLAGSVESFGGESTRPIAPQSGRASLLNVQDRVAGLAMGSGQDNSAGSFSALLAPALVSAVTTSSVNLDVGTISKMMLSTDGAGSSDSGDFELWGAGNVRFGTKNQQDTTGPGVDFTTSGASIGMDKRFNDQWTLGMGIGYARDKSSVGSDGTGSNSTGNSVTGYASYQATNAVFVDALVGYGSLNFVTARYVAAANDFARASRSGLQTWGSVATGYEYRNEGLLLSPYGRYDLAVDQMDAVTETGAGVYALNYASQSRKSQQISLGFRAEAQKQTDAGLAMPRARVEYQHVIEGAATTSLAYADSLSSRYYLSIPTVNSDSWLLGVGNSLAMHNEWNLDFEYQRQYASGQQNIQAVDVRLSKRF